MKSCGGKARQRRVEPQHDRAGEPGRGQEPQLRALVGEAEQRLVGPEEAARMRLEGERRGRPAERLGARARGRDHGAVAAMHAVEIADGDDGAVERVIARAPRRAPRRTALARGSVMAAADGSRRRSLITVAPVIASRVLFNAAAGRGYQRSRASPLRGDAGAAKMLGQRGGLRIVAGAEFLGVDARGHEQAVDAEGGGALEIGAHRICRSPARGRAPPAPRARPRRSPAPARRSADRACRHRSPRRRRRHRDRRSRRRNRPACRRARPPRRDWRRSSAARARACARSARGSPAASRRCRR